MRLAQREFSLNDQKRFATVSGDHNPIHIDPLQARRTQAGGVVVHGIHLLLWSLDSIATAQPSLPPLRRLRAHFNKFVYLQERVDVDLTEQGSSRARLSISVDDAPRSKISIEFRDIGQDCPDWGSSIVDAIPFSQAPADLDFEKMRDQSGRVSFAMTSEDAIAMFPAATKWLGARRIGALAASTHVVGMVCPGLHSIYSELQVETCAERAPDHLLAFRVTEADQRFRSIQLAITGGGLTGTVESSARIPPVQQASMESLQGVVGPADFTGSVALIVGGSRGLGELTAKLIATGGGRVIITWRSGKDDAERVAQEIRSGGGACETLAYDASQPATEQLALLVDSPTHVYYFATPAISRPQSKIFSGERLEEFLAVYVNGLWQLAKTLHARQPRLSIFYPSSIFVNERPRGMTEYSMAKAAGEVLCADMNESMAPLRMIVCRLPRLLTDQTASTTALEIAPALETMLHIVREVQSRPS
ncbi:MAG: hypothetical protein JWQ49_3771 [Edaphobacter sp.]|nr:hypothetical protein [Edaphobacter sp.]